MEGKGRGEGEGKGKGTGWVRGWGIGTGTGMEYKTFFLLFILVYVPNPICTRTLYNVSATAMYMSHNNNLKYFSSNSLQLVHKIFFYRPHYDCPFLLKIVLKNDVKKLFLHKSKQF